MTALQFEKPLTDLRRRMLQDMTNRNFGAKTQHDYIRHIETFARFLGRAPNTATGDDIRRFQAEQIARGAQPPKMNTQASALRFFLSVTCGRADLAHQIARTHYPRKLPRVLSPEDVARVIEAAPGPGSAPYSFHRRPVSNRARIASTSKTHPPHVPPLAACNAAQRRVSSGSFASGAKSSRRVLAASTRAPSAAPK